MRKVRVLILAAGYGSRLEDDIKKSSNSKYHHLVGLPKPLLPLGGIPLSSHWIIILKRCGITVRDVFVVTNEKFYNHMKEWCLSSGIPLENLLNDKSTCNKDRRGAIADMELIVETNGLRSDPLLVIGGDTLFYEDFSLKNFLNEYNGEESLLVYYKLHEEFRVRQTGILELDSDRYVRNFLEKPDPSETKSRIASPCFYLFRPEALSLLREYMGNSGTLVDRDAPGSFIGWLYERDRVRGYEVSDRFDVGRLTDYELAQKHFSQMEELHIESN